ncbi:MAG: YrdB family protein [Chloroflexota bacterium]
MEAAKSANLALSFLLELCALAGLAYWGWQTGDGTVIKSVLAVGAPLAAAVLWGVFASPRAAVPLKEPLHLLFVVVFFGAAAAALAAAGQPLLALVFAVVLVINHVLLYAWKQ